ncbi:hypothetical protein RBH26_20865 [Natronolimnohabitans sp. A-GB9]|uniref:hypothetical protein n=1 Tax=Natronolimnohabitans sp. A-GB9 TaxID=3069757 RepID=UPI0027B2DAF5|nr:hypothetical protein [Natronolimnohabitans sp. A-GB9]MDQ2052897.1 hypothetical protein [Natronolimnohabitans sp. A-GB9]
MSDNHKTVTEILEESAETYKLKNADYGRSWQNIGHVLHTLANEQPVVLETPEDWIAVGLFTRRLDKIARSFNMDLLDHDPNFERAVDADEDESVYAAMQAENKYDKQRLVKKAEKHVYVVDPERTESDPTTEYEEEDES